ncbi:MAG: hypothetical protein ACYC3S_04115 [Chloroflexota bacterium]
MAKRKNEEWLAPVGEPASDTGIATLFLLLVVLAVVVGFALYFGTGFLFNGSA